MHEFEVLLILMVVVWVFGKIFRALSLPVIFGELLGGILLGPLVLGVVDAESEFIKILSELGIFFLMLHAGLETDPNKIFGASKTSILISLGSVLFPFGAGIALGHAFDFSWQNALFMGVVFSTTSIIIAVRLFKEFGFNGTPIANTILAAAVIDDILALDLFSIVLTVIEKGTLDIFEVFGIMGKIFLFFGIVLWIGHKTAPHLPRVFHEKGFTFAMIVALSFGLFAEFMGLHAILGAFLAGLFIREEILDKQKFKKIEDRIYGLSYSFLGPIFFVSLAFYIDFQAIISYPFLLISVVLAATLSKLLGATGVGKLLGMSWKDAGLTGFSMNTHATMGLVFASVGIREGIIEPDMFSLLVLMAFSTTIISIFAIRFIVRKS